MADHDETHVDRHEGSHKLLAGSATRVKDWKASVKQDPSGCVLYDEHQQLLQEANVQYADFTTTFQVGDALIVVDMQNDFLPEEDAPDGGKFGVAEGAMAAANICDLIKKASAGNAMIIATRDYHSKDHCSFMTNDGPFPPHCIQGTKGSMFFQPIEHTLAKVRAQGADVRVVFKGFMDEADSFGGIGYGPKYFEKRQLGNAKGAQASDVQCFGCSAVDWTGCFSLKCSNLEFDLNAPPDVMAVLSRKSLSQELREADAKRLFVVGLAMDFCVLDTAVNAASSRVAPEIFMPVEATRPAHIPGLGSFGSGFLSDPIDIVKKAEHAGVALCHINCIQ